jgi:hypothetical protein
MQILIILFGLLIIAMAGWMAVKPETFTAFLLRHAGSLWMHLLAAGVRIVMGIALILYADWSRFPLALEILGWIAVTAGVVLGFTPPSRFESLVRWAFNRLGKYARAAAVLAVLFGGFLIYAVL